MSTLAKIGAAAAGVVVLLALFLVLRPDDGGEGAPSVTTTETSPSETDTGETAPTTETDVETTTTTETETGLSGPTRIRLVVRGGQAVGGVKRPTVRQGERVVLVIRSDVADEVHLHGYDVKRDVTPGAPAHLAFRATIAGRFEVELEGRGLLLADLEVRP
ncbi:MAG TPA: hypothetical protein VES61_06110 [Gaiellaceae bacterium]|nr:hypothetical protein [Gaiellaceae bacterium]